MASQGPEWELSKENVLPLRGGRDASKLNAALVAKPDALIAQDAEHQSAIHAAASGSDPLAAWVTYVKWLSESYPKGAAQTLKAVEEAVRRFADTPQYREDSRYVRLWVQYAHGHKDPRDVFAYMRTKQIGAKSALFYEASAYALEFKHDFAAAAATYEAGVRAEAQPIDRLQRRQAAFEKRMAARVRRDAAKAKAKAEKKPKLSRSATAATTTPQPELSEKENSTATSTRRVRPALGDLPADVATASRRPMVRQRRIAMHTTPLHVQNELVPAMPNVQPEVYQDPQETPSMIDTDVNAALQFPFMNLGKLSEVHKEDEMTPQQWAGVTVPQDGSLASSLQKKTPVGNIEVYRDSQMPSQDTVMQNVIQTDEHLTLTGLAQTAGQTPAPLGTRQTRVSSTGERGFNSARVSPGPSSPFEVHEDKAKTQNTTPPNDIDIFQDPLKGQSRVAAFELEVHQDKQPLSKLPTESGDFQIYRDPVVQSDEKSAPTTSHQDSGLSIKKTSPSSSPNFEVFQDAHLEKKEKDTSREPLQVYQDTQLRPQPQNKGVDVYEDKKPGNGAPKVRSENESFAVYKDSSEEKLEGINQREGFSVFKVESRQSKAPALHERTKRDPPPLADRHGVPLSSARPPLPNGRNGGRTVLGRSFLSSENDSSVFHGLQNGNTFFPKQESEMSVLSESKTNSPAAFLNGTPMPPRGVSRQVNNSMDKAPAQMPQNLEKSGFKVFEDAKVSANLGSNRSNTLEDDKNSENQFPRKGLAPKDEKSCVSTQAPTPENENNSPYQSPKASRVKSVLCDAVSPTINTRIAIENCEDVFNSFLPVEVGYDPIQKEGKQSESSIVPAVPSFDLEIYEDKSQSHPHTSSPLRPSTTKPPSTPHSLNTKKSDHANFNIVQNQSLQNKENSRGPIGIETPAAQRRLLENNVLQPRPELEGAVPPLTALSLPKSATKIDSNCPKTPQTSGPSSQQSESWVFTTPSLESPATTLLDALAEWIASDPNCHFLTGKYPEIKVGNDLELQITPKEVRRFSIDALAGTGYCGQSKVYIAECLDSDAGFHGDATVAIKVISKNTVIWEYYIYKTLHNRIENPIDNISRVLGVYDSEASSYLILESCSDASLADVLTMSKSSRVPEMVAMFFTVALLRAVENVHKSEIIHTDVTLDNVLLRTNDAADFSQNYCADGSNGWGAYGVLLVDFNHAIDTNHSLYKSLSKEEKIAEATKEGLDHLCAEYRKPNADRWFFDIDCYAITVCSAKLMGLEGLELSSCAQVVKHQTLWESFFADMSAMHHFSPSSETLAVMEGYRELFEAELASDSSLKGALTRVLMQVADARYDADMTKM